MVVYRPIDPKRFDGTVIVEWLNVSGGVDAAAAWLTDHVQMIRSGMVYVGVSVQAAGIDGSSGSLGASAGQVGGIKGADPARYGSLEHPGDSYSYSMYEQAGAAIRRDAATVLGGLEPKRVLALGESQSAFRLVTYIDALQATVPGDLRRLLRLQPWGLGCRPLPGAPATDHASDADDHPHRPQRSGHDVRNRGRPARPRIPPGPPASDQVHPRVGSGRHRALRHLRPGRVDDRQRERHRRRQDLRHDDRPRLLLRRRSHQLPRPAQRRCAHLRAPGCGGRPQAAG